MQRNKHKRFAQKFLIFKFLTWYQSNRVFFLSDPVFSSSSSSSFIVTIGDNTIVTQTETQSGNGNQIDASHPLYFHSSDSPGMSLVNFTFDGRGFQGWRRTIIIALSAKNKLGFIDGTCKISEPNSSQYQAWSRCNDMVTSWLLNSLSKT